jgi:tetratricopeptide (TPR) repeat protein
MEWGWLQKGVLRAGESLSSWLGEPGSREAVMAAAALAIGLALAIRALRWQRQRTVSAVLSARAQGEADALRQELRQRLSEPGALFAEGGGAAPTMGASEAFEGDIEAVARTVLQEAGGHRAKAKELLRRRMDGNGADTGALNGSAVAYWRQLGALSLLDNSPDALRAYTHAAELAPKDAEAQMLVGVLHLRNGSLAEAEAAFRRLIEICGPDGASFMRCRGHAMLGDVHALREETDAAMAAYHEAQRGVKALLQHEPDNASYQRALSVTCDRIGDMHARKRDLGAALSSYRSGLEIVEGLSRKDPDNAVWQHDLSVSHDRIGEVLDKQGDRAAALASFSKGLAIAQSLARREPESVQRQWDLSASHDRVGDVEIAQGRIGEALASYRRSTEIAEALVKRDPSHPGWQRDLAVSYHKLGSLQALEHPAEAREALEKGRAIIAKLAAIAAHQAQWRSDLSKFDDVLRTLRG